MKRLTGIILVLVLLSLMSSCSAGVAGVVHMYAASHVIMGNTLAIEIKPGSQVKPDEYHIVSIEEKDRGGRYRTYVAWSKAEIDVSKIDTVYIPLTNNEFRAYLGESSSKLKGIFKVTIDPKPLTYQQIQDMVDKKVLARR